MASRRTRSVVVTAAVVALAAVSSACAGPDGPAQVAAASSESAPVASADSTAAAPAAAQPAPVPEPAPAPAPVSVADPVRVSVPSVGIDAELIPLGLEDDGSLEVPDFDLAGWYVDGPEPGEPGASVVVGHVDSYTGPAVFFPLRTAAPGAEIEVTLADGAVQRFVVQSIEQFPKDAFPTEAVFGPTKAPTLRLVTCGGTFDEKAKSYLDNVVVFATQA